MLFSEMLSDERKEGREEGRLEGREEGRLEGREEGRLEGREEGRLEGREEGRAEGERLFAALTAKLVQDSRTEELLKASADMEFRRELYREYGIE